MRRILGRNILWNFFIYPYKHKNVFNRGLPLLKNAAPELNLGVKINQVYPKIITYYMGLDACLFQKGDIFLYLRVNHGN